MAEASTQPLRWVGSLNLEGTTGQPRPTPPWRPPPRKPVCGDASGTPGPTGLPLLRTPLAPAPSRPCLVPAAPGAPDLRRHVPRPCCCQTSPSSQPVLPGGAGLRPLLPQAWRAWPWPPADPGVWLTLRLPVDATLLCTRQAQELCASRPLLPVPSSPAPPSCRLGVLRSRAPLCSFAPSPLCSFFPRQLCACRGARGRRQARGGARGVAPTPGAAEAACPRPGS